MNNLTADLKANFTESLTESLTDRFADGLTAIASTRTAATATAGVTLAVDRANMTNARIQPLVHAASSDPDTLSPSESALLLGAFLTLTLSVLSFVTL